MIAIETSWICDHITVYPKSVSPEKTPTLELKWELVALALKQKMEIYERLKKDENCMKIVFLYVFLMQLADLCNWSIPFPIHAK
jgi:hypothetical protein